MTGLARVILLRRHGRELGLKVDRVEQIRKVASRGSAIPLADRDTDLSARYLRGLTRDALMLLNTERPSFQKSSRELHHEIDYRKKDYSRLQRRAASLWPQSASPAYPKH